MFMVVALAISCAHDDYEFPTYSNFLASQAEVWVSVGVMSRDECSRLFLQDYRYWDDQQEMIYRVNTMEPDCPEEIDRFFIPDFNSSRHSWELADKQLTRLETLIHFLAPQQQEALIPIILEQRRRKKIWWLLWECQDLRTGHGYRLKLQELRAFVGREMYEKKAWPSPTLQLDF